MTILDFAPTSRSLTPGVHTVALHEGMWRITRPDGEVLGYIERRDAASGSRFAAKRLLQQQRRFLPIGEFWSLDDALECFRF